MIIESVSEILSNAGYNVPLLNALIPNEKNYRVLLMQPKGDIEASSTGVRNRKQTLAHNQFKQFLIRAKRCNADLVITPEYSLPWDTLIEMIKTCSGPQEGGLWALGCESIKLQELKEIKKELEPTVTILYEDLDEDLNRFIDPLVYVFLSEQIHSKGEKKFVMLVQFKTYPMGDDDHFEINNLQCGSKIYRFGDEKNLNLVSLICSDVLNFNDNHGKEIYDRTLIIHIQLNKKPRQAQFRGYRERLLRYAGDETEIICLNWARNVCQWSGEISKSWHNIAGSAWYLRPSEFDDRDQTLCTNHRRGLYYTWLNPRRVHALFFNYNAAIFLLEATKVAHMGVIASSSRRRGPQLIESCIWSTNDINWVKREKADDEFSNEVHECGEVAENIKVIAEDNPITVERILALSAGQVGNQEKWYRVRNLDSFNIDESEVIKRVTFCHDPHEEARSFRVARLKRCGHLWNILKVENNLPPSLTDLNRGFNIEWIYDYPHQNVKSESGQRATVIYMGEEVSKSILEETHKRVAENLHYSYIDSDASLTAKQRLAVWFREDGATCLFDSKKYVNIDQTNDKSEFDIGREG